MKDFEIVIKKYDAAINSLDSNIVNKAIKELSKMEENFKKIGLFALEDATYGRMRKLITHAVEIGVM